MKTTTTTTRPQTATAEDINKLGTAIAYKVVSSTYQQTGVHFYQELLWGAYRDKQLFDKMVHTEYTDGIQDKIKANEDIKTMYQTASKDIKTQIKDLEKVDIFGTTVELYASVLEELEQNKILQSEYEEMENSINRIISADKAELTEAEKIKVSSTFSDFRDIANVAIYYILLAMKKSNIDYIPQGEKFRKLYRLICRYVRKYMSQMCNPDTSVATKTVIAKRPCTAEEVQNYITTTTTTKQDGTTEEKAEILTFKDDTTKCSYTIKWYNDSKQRKAGYYKRYRYITYSKYQYITDGNKNGDIKEFRIQAPFEVSFSDVEKILHIAEKCQLSAREQCFIQCFLSACQVVYIPTTSKEYTPQKEYKKILDYTYKKMARLGYPVESRPNFLQDLKRRIEKYYKSNNAVNQAIINDGITTGRTKQRTKQKQSEPLGNRCKVSLLDWTEKAPSCKTEFKSCIEWLESGEKCVDVAPTPKADNKKCKVLWTMFTPVDERKANSPLQPVKTVIITMSPTANIFNGKAEKNRTYWHTHISYTVLDID